MAKEKNSRRAFYLPVDVVEQLDKLAAGTSVKVTPQQLVRFFVAQSLQSYADKGQQS